MKDDIIILFIFSMSFVWGVILGLYLRHNDKEIGAMEVYRGNTTLEYTIRDSVKVDSCVIFLQK